ncbi:UNVERIFIED_CONTAM: hypothetical protein GTU68_055072 [Idotea baltica]|nr:hypothetical protein [Idotea baltica]
MLDSAAQAVCGRGLASTGITTVFDALRVGSITSKKARYDAYARKVADELLQARASNAFKISHFLHLRAEICSETLLEEMAEFGETDRVGIVSLMDHTPGQRQFRDLAALRVYLSKKRNMNEEEFQNHVENLKTLQAQFGQAHQAGAITHAARYGAVLASHDDTTAEQVKTSLSNGVTFAEFPTTIEAAQACRENGIAIMMGAPNIVRGRSHSGNVSAAELADSDLLDIISSDYVPAALLLSVFYLLNVGMMCRCCGSCNGQCWALLVLTGTGVAYKLGLRGDVLRVKVKERTPLLRGAWSPWSQNLPNSASLWRPPMAPKGADVVCFKSTAVMALN